MRQTFAGRRIALQLFNLFFVVIYQNILLLLLVVPQVVMLPGNTRCDMTDLFTALTFLALVAVETMADNQQQVFQNTKYKLIAEEVERYGDYRAGFLRGGLFAYCRHPNYVCEVLLWWVFALFSLPRVGINWSLVGAANLTGLFTGSVDLTEQISSNKYPEYAEYQKQVPAYIPSLRMMTIK